MLFSISHTGAIAEYTAQIVSPGRHSMKKESECNRGYSYANKWAGYSAI